MGRCTASYLEGVLQWFCKWAEGPGPLGRDEKDLLLPSFFNTTTTSFRSNPRHKIYSTRCAPRYGFHTYKFLPRPLVANGVHVNPRAFRCLRRHFLPERLQPDSPPGHSTKINSAKKNKRKGKTMVEPNTPSLRARPDVCMSPDPAEYFSLGIINERQIITMHSFRSGGARSRALLYCSRRGFNSHHHATNGGGTYG